jgi:RNA polymerase sigma factor (sigma-70 family)
MYLSECMKKSYEDSTDEDLMLRYIEDDEEAFQVLYNRYYNNIFKYFAARTNGKGKDLVQEFFKKIHLNRDKYNPQYKLKPWLYKIAQNLLITDYRYSKLREHYKFDEERPCMDCEYRDVCLEDIQSAIETLPDVQKKALLMRFFNDCPYEEISKEINKTPINSRKIVSRAIKKLKDSLKI